MVNLGDSDTEYFISAPMSGLTWFRADSMADYLNNEEPVMDNHQPWRLAEINTTQQVDILHKIMEAGGCKLF